MTSPPDPTVAVEMEQEGFRPGESGEFTIRVQFPKGYHQTKDEVNFRVQPQEVKGIVFGSTVYPAGVVENGVVNYYDSAELKLEFFITDSIEEGEYPIPLNVHFQLCDENGICYFPASLPLDAVISVSGKPIGSHSALYFLLLAFLGGILLNLMPCVLPLLSVKALNLINQSQGSKRNILLNAFSYATGILMSFLILSLVIIFLQQSGQLLGWGFQFQNPYFLIALISVIFLFSLSLFEVFILLPSSKGLNKASELSGKKGYGGSFFTGIFAVFVATPCTAPFLGAAMGFAFSQPPLIVLSIMVATGLGLSLPFLILGFFPGFFNHLPKPGKWMTKFQEIMAFLLMGTAVYLSSTLIKQIGEMFIPFLWFLLVLALAAWIWGWNGRSHTKKSFRRIVQALSILMIIGAAILLLKPSEKQDLSRGSIPTAYGKNWEKFSPEEIEQRIEEDATVFLAFSASWCTTCKINERAVLYTEKTEKLFEEYGVHPFKADLTSTNAMAMEWIYRYGRAGVPLYILYKPGKEPQILPELLSDSILLSYIKE